MSSTVKWSDEELRSKVGQLFIVGFHGQVLSEDIKKLITEYKVGAVVLFQRNVASATQLQALTYELQTVAKAAGLPPLFIAIDQENGLVARIKPPIAVQFPGSMALGATGEHRNAFDVARATAGVLRELGVNMNYAPVADINSEPRNPVIGVRSPSDDPEVVGRFVSAQVKGLREGGIVPCVKHFPGHGDTAVDSHYGLPVIMKNRVEVEECELVPFRRVVAEGVEAVMTAHIAMPELAGEGLTDAEKNLPASLNPFILKILRERMKFEGMIVSDCLEMDGVRATYGTEKGAVAALKAGTDAVMICHTMSAQTASIELVEKAVNSGELSQDDIEKSVNRVMQIKKAYLETPSTVPAVMSTEEQSSLAAELYAQSATVVRQEKGTFPLSRDPTEKIIFLSPGRTPLGGGAVDSGEEKTREPYTPDSFINILKAYNSSATSIRFFDSMPLPTESQRAIDEADVVILGTRNASQYPYQKAFGMLLAKTPKKLIVVATCDPYDFLDEVEDVRNYITVYEPTAPAFKAAVDIMFGVKEAKGTLPVASKPKTGNIRPLSTSSPSDLALICDLWDDIFPKWPISRERLTSILAQGSNGLHFIHEAGFCLSYLNNSEQKGSIACIGVKADSRGKGVGTALLLAARQAMRDTLKLDSASNELFGVGVYSVFPRFWPGVPQSFSKADRNFFLHRGFRKSSDPIARDLFKCITKEIAPPAVLTRVAGLPLAFAPWSPALYTSTMAKQRENFSHNQAWIGAYEKLAAANQHHEALVVFDAAGAQVGWTLMCSPGSVLRDDFAFLHLLPSKEKTGLIACVGIDKSARGGGIGQAMLVAAMKDMKRRGVEGVFIDWVVIKGFYESLGFEDYWKYEKYDW